MRAGNLSQVGVRCGRLLADSSLIVRACLASGAGHAAALITMALVVGGDGRSRAGVSPPLLTVSTSEERVSPELEYLAQSSSDEFDRLMQPAPDEADEATGRARVDYNSVIAEWLSRKLASPVALAGLMPGGGGSGALKADARLVIEAEEKATTTGRNPGRTASFYGVEAEGHRFVFVVDISGSMAGSRFRRARAELCQSIENLHADQSFYVILFNTGAMPMPSIGMAAANPANVQLLGDWLKETQCQGETNPAPALAVALAMKPDAVYLLSDGKFDPRLAETVSQLQVFQRIPIHTIGFASRKGEKMLRAISQVSGGTYRYVH